MKIFIFILLTYSSIVFSSDFVISQVVVKCIGKSSCSDIEKVFSSLRRTYTDEQHFYNVLKLYVSNEGIKNFEFTVIKKDNKNSLNILLAQKMRIKAIDGPYFKRDFDIDFPSILPLKPDEFLDNQKVKDTENLFLDIAKDNGFPGASVSTSYTNIGSEVIVRFDINLKKPTRVNNIIINSNSKFLEDYISKKITYHNKQPFNVGKIKVEIEELRKIFIQFGYYLIDFGIKYKYLPDNKVNLFVDLKNTNRYAFYFDKLDTLSVEELKEYLSVSMIGGKREFQPENVRALISDRLYDLGYTASSVKVKKIEFTDFNNDTIIGFTSTVEPGIRGKVERISFKGNSALSNNEIERLFYLNATDQAQESIFDFSYIEGFSEVLREKYISQGFVSVYIDKPLIQRDKDQVHAVTYKIREGIRANIESLKINGVKLADLQELLTRMSNKSGKPFNPISFKQDLTVISDYLKNQGYYFTKITNINSKDLVKYFADNSLVSINIDLFTGPKIYADDIIIIGNQKTRKILIKRELEFKSGSLITSKRIENSQTNLLSLGIFSSVQIKPVSQNKEKTDILIFVREKDFGSVEFAPGVRSDIGFKISTAVTYNNLDGMNKKISFNGTINRRFDLSSLDGKRELPESLLEYDTSINYSENHIFHSDYDFGMSLKQARKRFYSFDVDIQRVSFTASRDFTGWLNVSLRQQVEIFSQYNASDEINHGHFQVGSLTPAINLDFRNRKVNPSAGALFSFSTEFANSALFSESNDDITIDYYKLVNRNKIYIPMGQKSTLAISTAFGIQENKATGVDNGKIPHIKVFRLTGADIVRGYEDREINTLIRGLDVSDVEVTLRAYMANIKVEPRYFLSDSTILGVFYDAGRVFIDEFSGDSLRSSVGLSFKFVTPVGTLDIDYGIKTLRKKDSSGNLESPGKLHVSIGFF